MDPLRHRTPPVYENLVISGGRGSTLTTADGRAIIDMTSGFGVAALGYGNERVALALEGQYRKLSHAIPSVIEFDGQALAANTIAARVGRHEDGVVLTTSGSEAVEVAMKAAAVKTGGRRFISISGAYHGQSIGALRVIGQRSVAGPLRALVGDLPDIVPFPTDDGEVCLDGGLWSLELVHHLLASDSFSERDLAGVIVEPMQNQAGYRTLPRSFCEGLTALCHEFRVPLIADEVFTGFGRCGAWSLSPLVGLEPDLVTFGKAMTGGVPGGACVGDRDLIDGLYPADGFPLHAPTFYNSPIVCAAVGAAIEEIEERQLVVRAQTIEQEIRASLADVTGNDHQFRLRGQGAAVALVASPELLSRRPNVIDEFITSALEQDVLVLNSGFPWNNTISLSPPLSTTSEELAVATAVIRAVVHKVSG